MQCGDRNFEDIRRKNIITKIRYVDGFDGSYSFSNPWSSGFAWDQHSWQYCMMVRNERHWTLNRADHSRRSSSNKQIKSVACPVSWKGNMMWKTKIIQNWNNRSSRWWCRVINMKVKITEHQLFKKILKTHYMQQSVLRHWGSMSPVWTLLLLLILLLLLPPVMTNSEGDEMRLSIREVNSCMKTDVLEDGGLYTSLKIDEETEICMHDSNVVKVGRVILDGLRNELRLNYSMLFFGDIWMAMLCQYLI